MTHVQALTIWAAARERARDELFAGAVLLARQGRPKRPAVAARQPGCFRSAPCRSGHRQPYAGLTKPRSRRVSAFLGGEQQLRFNRPDPGHEVVHLGHGCGLVLGGLGLLARIGAVSSPVRGLSDLDVERVLSRVQAGQLLS